jgi:hypothetical protein
VFPLNALMLKDNFAEGAEAPTGRTAEAAAAAQEKG